MDVIIPPLIALISTVIELYIWIVIAGIVASWLVHFRVINTSNRFVYLVLVRSVVYIFLITAWLLITNSIWYSVNGIGPFNIQMREYFIGEMFAINLVVIMISVVVVVGIGAINNLRRKGELIAFILGRYHEPREVERIFCFIDLKNSTAIAEKLGHRKYASFIKAYYSDISEALRATKAGIYQYVGDEIVLSWPLKEGLKDNRLVYCFFLMQDIFQNRKAVYLEKYGVYPEFRAALHGGKVIVTWVGDLKKEIVYIGDVVNTTARIREDCKRLEKDFLISEELLQQLGALDDVKATFIEETVPRGKAKSVKVYSLMREVKE